MQIDKKITQELIKNIEEIPSFDVPIGKSEDPIFSRIQEKTVYDSPNILGKRSKELYICSIVEQIHIDYEKNKVRNGYFRDQMTNKIIPLYENNDESCGINRYYESLRGDFAIKDRKTDETIMFSDLKVGSKNINEYFGAPSICSVLNKLMGQNYDGIPRILICISNRQKITVNDPYVMVSWASSDGFLKMSNSTRTHYNKLVKYYNGKIKVGNDSRDASTKNILADNDFFPSFPFARNLFKFKF